MSETAKTLIKSAIRVVSGGRDPTAEEQADGFEALKMMLRSWSAQNINLYYSVTDTLAADGSESYTIGSGGDINTVRPAAIRGARTADNLVEVIDEARYRRLALGGSVGSIAHIWYNPDYPLGLLYPWPQSSGTVYLDSLRELSDPALITSDVEFPPEYDEAIKFNLAIRLAPEYGKLLDTLTIFLARDSLSTIQSRNFASQITTVRLGIPDRVSGRYNIDEG